MKIHFPQLAEYREPQQIGAFLADVEYLEGQSFKYFRKVTKGNFFITKIFAFWS